MGKRHRKPTRRRRVLSAQGGRDVAFWVAIAAALVTAAGLYEAAEYRVQHSGRDYVSHYVPADTGAKSLSAVTPRLP